MLFAVKPKKTEKAVIESFLAYCVEDLISKVGRFSTNGQKVFLKALKSRNPGLRQVIFSRWEDWENGFCLLNGQHRCLDQLNRTEAGRIIINCLREHFFGKENCHG